MKIRATETEVEMIPETPWEREQLQRIAAFREICVDITAPSPADSSCWPSLGPTGTVVFDVTPPRARTPESHD